MKSVNKLIVYLIILLSIMFLNNCKSIEVEVGKDGYIQGIFTKIDENTYGIDGKANPLDGYLYFQTKVKFKLEDYSRDTLLAGYQVGDTVSFMYHIYAIEDITLDWGVTISITSL